jgi:hypothetical protein
MHECDTPTSKWRKSSFSESGNCVEVANQDGIVIVRDTKRLGGDSILSFPSLTWQAFVDEHR